MSDYCILFSQTFYGLLFSHLTITDVTSYVDHTVHLTKSLLQTVLQMLLSQKFNSHNYSLCSRYETPWLLYVNHEQLHFFRCILTTFYKICCNNSVCVRSNIVWNRWKSTLKSKPRNKTHGVCLRLTEQAIANVKIFITRFEGKCKYFSSINLTVPGNWRCHAMCWQFIVLNI